MSRNETRITFDHIKKMLESRDAEDRIEGWIKLYDLLHGGELAITRAVLDELYKPERKHAIAAGLETEWSSKALQELAYAMYGANKAIQKELERAVEAKYEETVPHPRLLLPGSLAMKLFEDFAAPSWLAHLVGVRPCDERAVALAMSLLSRAEYPLLERKEFCRGTFTFTLPGEASVKAVLIVGRPGLFFEDGAAGAEWQMQAARYAFPPFGALDYEPKDWPDPTYHRVLESIAPGVPPLEHRTHFDKKNGVLTDYAIVQKYEVLVNGHTVVVLVCAGCTFLGTFAAVQWATRDLLDHHRPGTPIPVPKGLEGRWHRGLEVLIRVTAELDREKIRLPPMRIKVLDLRVDGRAWYHDKFAWNTPTPRHIVLFHPKGERPTNANVTAVWLDGRRAQIKSDHETLRLLAALCRLKERHGKRIPIGALAEDTTIWADGEVRDEKRVAAQLRLLKKRHLGPALNLDATSSVCTLSADVRFAEND